MSAPGVKEAIRIIVDDRMARHEFLSTCVYIYDGQLTKNDPIRRQDLINIYLNSVNTALACMTEDLQGYLEAANAQLDHTQTIFAEEILANPMISKAIDNASQVLSLYIYFKLHEFGFVSDDNIFVLDTLGADFYLITVYPANFNL